MGLPRVSETPPPQTPPAEFILSAAGGLGVTLYRRPLRQGPVAGKGGISPDLLDLRHAIPFYLRLPARRNGQISGFSPLRLHIYT